MKARLLEKYRNEVLPAMRKDFGRSNPHSLPRLEKICLNMGIGKAIDDSKILEEGIKLRSRGRAPFRRG